MCIPNELASIIEGIYIIVALIRMLVYTRFGGFSAETSFLDDLRAVIQAALWPVFIIVHYVIALGRALINDTDEDKTTE